MRTRLLVNFLALTALVVAPACQGDDPPGSLIVPFKIGANVPCSVLGVTDVTVALHKYTGASDVGDEIDTEIVACEDGQAEFNGLQAGRYHIRVSGVDGEDVIVADNFDNDPLDKGEVTSGAENTADVVTISPTPAKILVRWQLNGGFGMCTDVPITTFRVETYEKEGLSELLTYDFDCDPEEDAVMGYNAVIDPTREIAGDDLDLIKIDALDDKGASLVTSPLSFKMNPPGHGRTVKLTAVVDCAADCSIDCAPGKEDPDNAGMCLPD
ncbi:hypothetical protein [Nannocystis pusilla]|uniref:Lipoprotein n=1 Tax=Nannocystis pusilla TaxID=889268 RepID=A0ABS7U6V3_9BACT|nr:hypothetical protein [Nannocystis pusilla]MBZ5715996.1 hypothetical protein [Nannocystis pusilla]